jgi:hypothetical protein
MGVPASTPNKFKYTKAEQITDAIIIWLYTIGLLLFVVFGTMWVMR